MNSSTSSSEANRSHAMASSDSTGRTPARRARSANDRRRRRRGPDTLSSALSDVKARTRAPTSPYAQVTTLESIDGAPPSGGGAARSKPEPWGLSWRS
jgi:hypothetical protein